MSENPAITVRGLADRLDISHDTAHRIKKEWTARQPAKKEEKASLASKIPFVAGGVVLSEEEATRYASILPGIIEDDADALDKYLVGRQKLVGEQVLIDQIWSNMSDKEINTLCRLMLKAGRHNPAAATAVRGLVESRDIISGLIIVAPRGKATGAILRKTYRRPHRRGERHG